MKNKLVSAIAGIQAELDQFMRELPLRVVSDHAHLYEQQLRFATLQLRVANNILLKAEKKG